MKQIGRFTNFIGLEPGVYSMGSPGVEQIASGNPITIQSAAAPVTELLIFGKTTQPTTTGAQLLNPELYSPDRETNGITFTKNENGTIQISGTSSGVSTFYLGEHVDALTVGEQYSIYGEFPNVRKSIAYIENGKTEYKKSFVMSENITSVRPYIQIVDGVTIDVVEKPMLVVGSTEKPWEPYTGGKPSPSPEYKQDMTNAGSSGQVNVSVTGANLLDVSNANVLKMYIANSGIGNWDRNWCVVIPIKPNTEYAISEKNQKTIRYAVTSEFPYDGVEALEKDTTNVYKNLFVSGNISEAKYLLIQLYGDFATQPDFSGIMVNEGSTVLPYQPYVTPQSLVVSTPNGLPGVPTTGEEYTYIDSTGQKWIADSVEYFSDGTGRYVKRCELYAVNENTNMIRSGLSNDGFSSFGIRDFYTKPSGIANSVCDIVSNCFVAGRMQAFNVEGTVFLGGDNSNILYFVLPTVDAPDAETAKQIAIEKGFKFLYVLAEPIITPLSAEQVAEFKALTTYEPTTVIQNDAGCWMQVGYYSGPAIQRLIIDAQKINGV